MILNSCQIKNQKDLKENMRSKKIQKYFQGSINKFQIFWCIYLKEMLIEMFYKKTKEIIYSLPGLEKEVSQNICENTFEDADKCKEYLKNLLKIIENKFYEIIK